MVDSATAKGSISPSFRDRVHSTLWGLVGGLLAVLASNLILLNWQPVKISAFDVDKLEKRQGAGSLKWSFHLRPKKIFVFWPTRQSGALLHAETDPDIHGAVPSLDWQAFATIRFFAKSSVEALELDEVNIFVGQDRLQYMFDAPHVLSTTWHEFELPFDRFRLAPWLAGRDRELGPMLSQVTGMGFDLKNSSRDLQAYIWIDFIRLVRKDGTVVVFSDADMDRFEFNGQKMTWFTEAQDY